MLNISFVEDIVKDMAFKRSFKYSDLLIRDLKCIFKLNFIIIPFPWLIQQSDPNLHSKIEM